MTIEKILELILNPATALIVGFVTVLYQSQTNQIQIAKERLEKAYHPIFLAIEPYLYKNVTFEEISPFLETFFEIDRDYSLYIYPSLRQRIHIINKRKRILGGNKYSDKEWTIVCNYVSNQYDKLCKQAKMPVRSIAYRINARQYPTKFAMVIALIRLELFPILFYTAIMAIISPIGLLIVYLLASILLFVVFYKSYYDCKDE